MLMEKVGLQNSTWMIYYVVVNREHFRAPGMPVGFLLTISGNDRIVFDRRVICCGRFCCYVGECGKFFRIRNFFEELEENEF